MTPASIGLTQALPHGSTHAVLLPWQRRPAADAPITAPLAANRGTNHRAARRQPTHPSAVAIATAVAGACRAGEHTGLASVGVDRPVHPPAAVAEVT